MTQSPAQPPSPDLNLKKYPWRPAPCPCGTRRQVLFDDFLMDGGARCDQFPHAIRFSAGSVRKHGCALFDAEPPWETGLAWLSVLREGGTWRMWYNSYQEGHRGLVVSYAESRDGIHFERVPAGAIEWRGSRSHNVVYAGGHMGVSPELGNVFIDPHAEEGETYKLIHAEWNGPFAIDLAAQGIYSAAAGTLRAAYSADGIHWTRYVEDFLPHYPDSQNAACWDADLRKYVIYHRSWSNHGALELPEERLRPLGRGRAVGRIESEDFRNWSPSELALEPDLHDTLNTDIYNSGYSRHPDAARAHYLFPSFYHHYEGNYSVQACVSRDNRTWVRPTRETFIPLGARGEFDSFIISVAPGLVPVSPDEWALYYRSGNKPHSPNEHILARMTEEEKQAFGSRVGRALVKRDRIVGVQAGEEPGRFVTRVLSFEGDRLVANVEPTGPHPELRVQLLDAGGAPLPGHTHEDCVPVTADGLDAPLAWRGGDRIGAQVPRGAVRLHFLLRDVRLYAFQFLA